MLMPHSSRNDWNASRLMYWGNHCTPCVLAPRSWKGWPCSSSTVGALNPAALPMDSLPCWPTGVSL